MGVRRRYGAGATGAALATHTGPAPFPPARGGEQLTFFEQRGVHEAGVGRVEDGARFLEPCPGGF